MKKLTRYKLHTLVVVLAMFAAFIGYQTGYHDGINDADLETTVINMPRGAMNIPAQWLMMNTTVGPEKMMLVFGYADNESVCDLLKSVAKIDAPERDFWCEGAN